MKRTHYLNVAGLLFVIVGLVTLGYAFFADWSEGWDFLGQLFFIFLLGIPSLIIGGLLLALTRRERKQLKQEPGKRKPELDFVIFGAISFVAWYILIYAIPGDFFQIGFLALFLGTILSVIWRTKHSQVWKHWTTFIVFATVPIFNFPFAVVAFIFSVNFYKLSYRTQPARIFLFWKLVLLALAIVTIWVFLPLEL